VGLGNVVRNVDEAVRVLQTCGLEQVDPKSLRIKPCAADDSQKRSFPVE